MTDSDGPVALVTGGAGGLGRAAAAALASRGWRLCLQHDRGAACETAVEAIRAAAEKAGHDAEVAPIAADLADADDRDQLVEAVIDRFEQIDMLVNAAFGAPATATDLLELTEGDFRQVTAAYVESALFLTRLVANEMVRLVEAGLAERPKIVTINSIGAYATSADHAPQCLARAALSMLTRLFADRLGEHGINVYEIRVGIITAGPEDPAHARYDRLIQQGLTPIRRWGRPGDVGRAVAAIAEDLLPFSTGEVINVDGGFHLRRL